MLSLRQPATCGVRMRTRFFHPDVTLIAVVGFMSIFLLFYGHAIKTTNVTVVSIIPNALNMCRADGGVFAKLITNCVDSTNPHSGTNPYEAINNVALETL